RLIVHRSVRNVERARDVFGSIRVRGARIHNHHDLSGLDGDLRGPRANLEIELVGILVDLLVHRSRSDKFHRPLSSTLTQSMLPPLGPIEEHPGGELPREFLEAMFHACRDKQHLTGLKWMPCAATYELTLPRDDHVHFVASVP